MKSKIQKLKKSEQDKRRYFITDASSNEKIEKSLLEYIGILGLAKSNYKEVKTKSHSKKVIGSCSREELHNVRTALTLAGINIEKVASTIKGLSKK